MKNTKKIASIVLAIVMVLALSVSAFATEVSTDPNNATETTEAPTATPTEENATDPSDLPVKGKITIKEPTKGQTYTLYKIFNLSYQADSNPNDNVDNGAYSYTVDPAWEDFITAPGKGADYVERKDGVHVTWKNSTNKEAEAALFAKEAIAYATTNKIAHVIVGKAAANNPTPSDATAPVAKYDAGKLVFSNLDLGYYLIDTTMGTLCSLDTTNTDVEVLEKNEEPENVKTVQENPAGTWGNKNDASIGDTVNFQSIITVKKGAEKYVLHDTMSEGLTFKGTVTVTLLNETHTPENTTDDDVAADNYTLTARTADAALADGCTFEVEFKQSFIETLAVGTKIVVSYSAELNEQAKVGEEGNPNESHLVYGQNGDLETVPSTTKTFTWNFNVLKHNAEGKPLAGAEFTISTADDGSNPIQLVRYAEKDAEGVVAYRVASSVDKANTTLEKTTTITTTDSGKFSIHGLDAGTYYLTETKAPAGYNSLNGAQKVIIASTAKDNGTDLQAVVQIEKEAEDGTMKPETVTTVDILNQTGTELPSTGGIGTTIFYVVGSILLVGAAVLLIAKRRMSLAK